MALRYPRTLLLTNPGYSHPYTSGIHTPDIHTYPDRPCLAPRHNVFDNDAFDVFTGHSLDPKKVHQGKRLSPTPPPFFDVTNIFTPPPPLPSMTSLTFLPPPPPSLL